MRSPKTLRKYFAAELAAGFAEAHGAVARVAYEMAESGKYPAMTMFWLKAHALWSERMEIQSTEEEPSRGPGAELIFARLEPMSESEIQGYESVGRDGEYYLYRHARDSRNESFKARDTARKQQQERQEEPNVEA